MPAMNHRPPRIVLGPGVLSRELEGEAVLLSLDAGQYFGLDEIGTRVWSLLLEHGDVEPVVRAVVAEYEVTEAQFRADLERFVHQMVANGLLRWETP
jgi:hypothetical protein